MVLRKNNDHQAQFMSSNIIYERLIKDDDPFEKILKEFDFSFIYDEVKPLYCLDNGRPAYDPVMLFKASLVQRLKGLSDQAIEDERQIRYLHQTSLGDSNTRCELHLFDIESVQDQAWFGVIR